MASPASQVKGFTAAAGVAVLLFVVAWPTVAQQAPSSRPSPMEVRDAWIALRQAMLTTRNADNRSAISVEEAERRFAAHAEMARLLIQGYDEPASGKILPPGGTISGDALVGGYLPTLARAYCSWMAAQRATDSARKYAYYTAVYESLWHGAGDEPGASSKQRKASQIHPVYDSPFVRRMAVAAALARRRLGLELAQKAGETEVAAVSVTAEIADLDRLRKLPPSAFTRVPAQPDVEDIVGKSGYLELLDKSVSTVLAAELEAGKPRFRMVVESPEWQAEGSVKVIRGAVETLAPVTVKVVDAATGQALPNASQKNVLSEFDLRVSLEEKPEPISVKLVLDDPLTNASVTYDGTIALWNIPKPTIVMASRTMVIQDVAVAGLGFSVQRLRSGDEVRVAVGSGPSDSVVLQEKVTAAGDRTFTVPRFLVSPNAETPVVVSVRRGQKDVATEQLAVRSETTPLVTARVLRAHELVHLIEVTVSDFGSVIPRVMINGFEYPADVTPVETIAGSSEARSRSVFLIPWTGGAQSITVQARTVRPSDPVVVQWPSSPETIQPSDPRLGRLPDYQRELARGDLAAGERAYIGVLTDPSHAAEARQVLDDLYDYRLRQTPEGAASEAKAYLSGLRLLAKAVGRGEDLDARIAQLDAQIQAEQERLRRAEEERKAREAAQRAKEQKEREEAERRAREAQQAREALEAQQKLEKTPVEVAVVSSVFADRDGIAAIRLDVTGLVLGRRVKAVRMDDIDLENLEGLVTHSGSDARAELVLLAVPAPSATNVRVTVMVAYPNAGDVPKTITVPLSPGALPQLSAPLAGYLDLLRSGTSSGGAAPPKWVGAMCQRKLQRLLALANTAISAVTRDQRPPDALARAQAALASARQYADNVAALAGTDALEAVKKAEANLTTAIEPGLTVEGVSLVKRPAGGYVLADAAAVRVKTWADTVTVKFGDQTLQGSRTGGEWRFPLAGLRASQGKVAVTAEVPFGTQTLRAQQELTIELPAAAVAFNFKKPDFVYCDDGTGSRSLVFNANDAGRNADTIVEFDPQGIKLIAWDVVDSRGNVVPGTERTPKPPPLDGKLQIEDGRLSVGAYTIRVRLWDSDDASQAPARADVKIRVAVRAVAFVVGINYYGTGEFRTLPLRHAADDAMSIRAKLIERGYAPENIVYVVGRNDSGTPEMRTNGLQNVKSTTPNDLSETKRPGQRFGLATSKVVAAAFDTFLKVLEQRKARHVLIFFAGHGTNVTASLGTRTALNVDHLIMADDDPSAPARVYVWEWPTRVKNLVNWGSKDTPVTVMCVYDACRNGTKAPFDAAPPDLSSDDGAVLCSALFSCRKGEQANENLDDDPKLAISYNGEVFKNGFFTYALLKALDELPPASVRMPDVITRANAILAQLVGQSQEKNKAVASAEKPYFERQSLRPTNDLRGWEQSLPVVYPAAQSSASTDGRSVWHYVFARW